MSRITECRQQVGLGDFAAVGGLLSYANDLEDIPYLTGIYVGRILNGVGPAELPVMQSITQLRELSAAAD